ncbi:MAG: hypothetical protein JO323_01200 [Acidobacteriia bacterium]|nr:hypothetical protein [Terriglobia bacterium]
MKIILATLISAALLPAADSAFPGATPLPKERYEEISRAALTIQSIQIEVQQLQLRLLEASRQLEETKRQYEDLLGKLRRELHAEGCELNPISKEWICPKAEKVESKPANTK